MGGLEVETRLSNRLRDRRQMRPVIVRLVGMAVQILSDRRRQPQFCEYQRMDARDSFREMLRDQVGPALRKEGFAGSGANWRRRNDAGDWGVVDFQKSAYGSAHSVDFYINLALVVEPERQFSAWLKNQPVSRVPSAADNVWWSRLDPPPRQGRDRFDRRQFGDGAACKLIESVSRTSSSFVTRTVLCSMA